MLESPFTAPVNGRAATSRASQRGGASVDCVASVTAWTSSAASVRRDPGALADAGDGHHAAPLTRAAVATFGNVGGRRSRVRNASGKPTGVAGDAIARSPGPSRSIGCRRRSCWSTRRPAPARAAVAHAARALASPACSFRAGVGVATDVITAAAVVLHAPSRLTVTGAAQNVQAQKFTAWLQTAVPHLSSRCRSAGSSLFPDAAQFTPPKWKPGTRDPAFRRRHATSAPIRVPTEFDFAIA